MRDAYVAMKSGGQTSAPNLTPPKKQWRMKGRGFMLTYNKPNWGHAPQALFALYLLFLRSLVEVLGCSKWTATCEQSLKSKDEGRVHIHAYLEWAKAIDEGLDDRFIFEGVHPRADCVGAVERC